jgi:hypothetical protein
VTGSLTASINVFCTVTSGTAQTATSTVELALCDGAPTITGITVSPGAAGCKYLTVTYAGNPESFGWYKGARGDTSQPAGTSTTVTVCPAQSGMYWVRVSAYNETEALHCYSDSASVSAP